MKLESGKFYSHASGSRQIAVLGPVETYRWGLMFLIEEADKSGHAISCAGVNQECPDETWIEIGRDEWFLNFEDEFCDECGRVFKDGEDAVPTEDGPLHADCFAKRVKERSIKDVVTIH